MGIKHTFHLGLHIISRIWVFSSYRKLARVEGNLLFTAFMILAVSKPPIAVKHLVSLAA